MTYIKLATTWKPITARTQVNELCRAGGRGSFASPLSPDSKIIALNISRIGRHFRKNARRRKGIELPSGLILNIPKDEIMTDVAKLPEVILRNLKLENGDLLVHKGVWYTEDTISGRTGRLQKGDDYIAVNAECLPRCAVLQFKNNSIK